MSRIFQPVDEAEISLRLGLQDLTTSSFSARSNAELDDAKNSLSDLSKSVSLQLHAALVELPKIHFLQQYVQDRETTAEVLQFEIASMRETLLSEQENRFSSIKECLKYEQEALHDDIMQAIEDRKAGPVVSHASCGDSVIAKPLTCSHAGTMRTEGSETVFVQPTLESKEQVQHVNPTSSNMFPALQLPFVVIEDDDDAILQICLRNKARHKALRHLT